MSVENAVNFIGPGIEKRTLLPHWEHFSARKTSAIGLISGTLNEASFFSILQYQKYIGSPFWKRTRFFFPESLSRKQIISNDLHAQRPKCKKICHWVSRSSAHGALRNEIKYEKSNRAGSKIHHHVANHAIYHHAIGTLALDHKSALEPLASAMFEPTSGSISTL